MQFGECRAEIDEDIEKVDQTEGRLFSKRRGFEVTQPQLASLINFVKPDRLDYSFDASGVEHPGLVAQTRPLSADGVLDQDCVARSIVAYGRTSQHMQKLQKVRKHIQIDCLGASGAVHPFSLRGVPRPMASAEMFQLDCPSTFPIKPMTRRAEPETDTRTALGPAALTATEIEPGFEDRGQPLGGHPLAPWTQIPKA